MADSLQARCSGQAVMMQEDYQKASQAIDAQRDGLAEAIVARQYELQPERWQAYGSSSRQKSVRDAGYHLIYLSEALATSNPALFCDYVAWVKVLFAGLGFPDDVLVTTLECTEHALQARLPTQLGALAAECIALGLDELRHAPSAIESLLTEDAPLGTLARQYLDALLQAKRQFASELILNAVDQGTSVQDIYLHVFQQSQHEIGRLWQMNRISVAQEHYCTAATQLIISQLYPHLFRAERTGRRMVATCVGDELHELGMRMVADFFEMDGWDTYYLGGNTPADSIVQAVMDREADLLGISATMTFHVRQVAELIGRLRSAFPGDGIITLVGGYPFNVAPDLWREVGADAYARDAQEAVKVGNRLLGDR